MIILAVETSAKTASAALLCDGNILAEINVNNTMTHSQTLMPIIDSVLKYAEKDIDDVDVFAAAYGPGSFTGIRIGVATVKSLAHVHNKPCVGVNTLDALAENVPGEGLIVPMMDARCGQIYTAIFDREKSGIKLIGNYEAIQAETILNGLGFIGQKVTFVGDGVPVYREKIEQILGDAARIAPPTAVNGRASSVASVAYRMALVGKTVSYLELEPFYLRAPQAEREAANK